MATRHLPGLTALLLWRWPRMARAYQLLVKGGFPFMPRPRRGAQPMRRLRHQARLALFAAHPRWRQWLLRAVMLLAWPVGAVLEALRRLIETPIVDRPNGLLGWLRRAGDMLLLAWFDNISPRQYLAYRLHDPARRDRIASCFFGPEMPALLAELNRRNQAEDDLVQDKARFAELCRHHELPCIPSLAVFRGGVQVWPPGAFMPDQPDLWVKALRGSRGEGAARWLRQADNYRDPLRKQECRPAELVAQWRQRDCLVQPGLHPHPALAPLSDGSLVDFRLVTGIGRDGDVCLIAALALFPCGGDAARQYIFAGIGPAGDIRLPRLNGVELVEQHPDTGEHFSAATIPFWAAAVDLVIRAHGTVPAFSRFVFLGWDVAITVDGPLLIETNSGWNATNLQIGDGVPLGRTALPAIALAYLEPPPAGDAACV